MTRDKMKDVIHKLRKLRPYRKQQTEVGRWDSGDVPSNNKL